MSGQTEPKTLKTVERAFEVVEQIQRKGGGRVSEVANWLDLPKSTVYNHLVTLEKLGYLVRDGDEYQIALQFLCVGGHAATRKKAYTMTRAKVQKLAEETDERVQFIVEENGRAIYVHQASGDHAVQTDVRVGKRTHLHTTSAGKAILAHLPADRVHEIVDEWGLPALTPNTITDREELFDHLERVRDRGVAFNREERIKGQHAVGVPITDPNDRIIGAISVSGPTYRLQDEWFTREIPDLLLGMSNELELNLTYS